MRRSSESTYSTLLGDVGTAPALTATTSDLGLGTKMGVTYLTAKHCSTATSAAGFGGYAGGGVGRAWTSFPATRTMPMAFTGIAGAALRAEARTSMPA